MSGHGRDHRALLPSVDRVLTTPAAVALIERHGRALVLDAVREALAKRRAAGEAASIADIVDTPIAGGVDFDNVGCGSGGNRQTARALVARSLVYIGMETIDRFGQ